MIWLFEVQTKNLQNSPWNPESVTIPVQQIPNTTFAIFQQRPTLRHLSFFGVRGGPSTIENGKECPTLRELLNFFYLTFPVYFFIIYLFFPDDLSVAPFNVIVVGSARLPWRSLKFWLPSTRFWKPFHFFISFLQPVQFQVIGKQQIWSKNNTWHSRVPLKPGSPDTEITKNWQPRAQQSCEIWLSVIFSAFYLSSNHANYTASWYKLMITVFAEFETQFHDECNLVGAGNENKCCQTKTSRTMLTSQWSSK